MPNELERRVAFLQRVPLFEALDDGQLAQIAERIGEHVLPEGELLLAEGGVSDNLYLVQSGLIGVWQRAGRSYKCFDELEVGDFFGEKGLMENSPRRFAYAAQEDSRLLYLPRVDFFWVLRSFPQVGEALGKILSARREPLPKRFAWLGEDEIVYLDTRRHPAHLGFDLLLSALLLVVALMLFLLDPGATTPTVELALQVGGYLCLAGAALWAAWQAIDWSNDYFVVTDHRAVWLEQTIFQRYGRQEAPLDAIQSVNFRTHPVGRMLNYGDVVVHTYTGSLEVSDVKAPAEVKELVEMLVMRERRQSERAQQEVIRETVQASLESRQHELPLATRVLPAIKEPIRSKSGFLVTRRVEGDTITYHKHWFVLLKKTWAPLLLILVLLAGGSYLLFGGSDPTGLIAPLLPRFWPYGLLLLLVLVLWLLYQYTDWRNDIYQVTKDSIVDSEKKPLGTEISKTAPLRNVLSLQHRRVGLLGLLLNFGNVAINVGDISLVFVGVHDPELVQQDIYRRLERLKAEQEAAEEERQRRRLGAWIRAYDELKESSTENDGDVPPEKQID